jgi:hypothetical protein
MRRTAKLSAAGEEVARATALLLREYEHHLGEIPDWVLDDLSLPQQIALLGSATRLRMPLADHDMVVGEYL